MSTMPIDAFVRPLLGLPIFQGLKPLQITEIVRRADRIVYKPGDVIIREDSVGDAAIVIIAGDALRVAGPAMGGDEEIIPSGALVGEMAMLIETEHSSTIVARTTVRALKISREEIHAQMAEDGDLADHFVRSITGRLSAILNELKGIDHTLAHSRSQVASGHTPDVITPSLH
jgi:CRP-like cAMP-binding protein